MSEAPELRPKKFSQPATNYDFQYTHFHLSPFRVPLGLGHPVEVASFGSVAAKATELKVTFRAAFITRAARRGREEAES